MKSQGFSTGVECMVRLGVLVLLAVTSATSFAQNAPVAVGTFNIEINDFSVTSTYNRDPQVGGYVLASEILKGQHSLHAIAKGSSKSSPMSREVTQELGPNPSEQVQVFRKGNQAELQVYTLKYNQSTGTLDANISKRAIKLLSGTWQDYESGKDVKVEVLASAMDHQDSVKTFISLAEDYYHLIYKDTMPPQYTGTEKPKITVDQVAAVTAVLNLNRVVVTQHAASVKIEAEVFLNTQPQPNVPAVPQEQGPKRQSTNGVLALAVPQR